MHWGIKLSLLPALLFVSAFSSGIRAQSDDLSNDTPEVKTTKKSDSSDSEIADLQSTDPDALIHSGDLIEVDVLGSTEFDWRGNVTPEGFLGGFSFTKAPIYAVCESEESIATRITEEYKSFLNQPTIVIRILDRSNRPIARLFGAVNSPQRFRIKREVFLNELLIIAGGISEKASGEIRILRSLDASCAGKIEASKKNRESQNQTDGSSTSEFVKVSDASQSKIITLKLSDILKGNAESNPRIFYGDIITVLEAEPIYVTGAVENPGKIDLRSELTVSRAIDSSGGLAKGAEERNITIFRRNGNDTETIKIDLTEIASGGSEDIVLKAFDIIDVPGKGGRGSKYPPVIQEEPVNASQKDPPLRIID